jgi:zinc protease
LEQAKTYLTGAYPLRFDSNAAIARILVGMQMDDLPVSYVETRNDRMNAVTLEQINRVASELMQPDKLTFSVVGQPAGL